MSQTVTNAIIESLFKDLSFEEVTLTVATLGGDGTKVFPAVRARQVIVTIPNRPPKITNHQFILETHEECLDALLHDGRIAFNAAWYSSPFVSTGPNIEPLQPS